MADYPRFDRLRQFSRRRCCLLATLVEEIPGTGRDYEDRHRQSLRRDRDALLQAAMRAEAHPGFLPWRHRHHAEIHAPDEAAVDRSAQVRARE